MSCKTLISAAEQTQHRSGELKSMMESIGNHLLNTVAVQSGATEDAWFEDLHSLCGTVCALALVQSMMPELVGQTDNYIKF